MGEGGRVVAVTHRRRRAYSADIAVIGIGVIPNTELATAAGVEVANGVGVNDFMETNVPEIMAIGDAVSFTHWELNRRIRLESVQNAVDQGKIVAATLLGKREAYRAVPWFWSDQGDVKLQMVGLSGDATRSVMRGAPGRWHLLGLPLCRRAAGCDRLGQSAGRPCLGTAHDRGWHLARAGVGRG